MQSNTLNNYSDEEIMQHVSRIFAEIKKNGFRTKTVLLDGSEVIVIATQEQGEGARIVPLFLLPSTEITLRLIDPDTKQSIFTMAGTN